MRVKKIRLIAFKRFDDLTIELGGEPKKVVALVGPNGCGKSSIFDAFEEKLKNFRNTGEEGVDFFSKALFYEDASRRSQNYDRNQAIQIDTTSQQIGRTGFYIRTAYRFTSKINVSEISAMPPILSGRDEPMSSIALDTRLETNYRRLLGQAIFEFNNGIKTGQQVREELIGKINTILKKVIEAEISNLGEVTTGKGQFYFKKGNSIDFPYANLSAGEKEVVDIVVDLLVKTQEYSDSVICIDEPELHLNTAVQRKLIIEIEKLIPDTCQLWVATHSIGFLRALQEELRDKTQVLDFSEKDYFQGVHTIVPIVPSRANWQRIFSTALEDLTGLVSPKRLIYCEGRDLPGADGRERGFDARVYNQIFSEAYNDTLFISSGGNTELDQRSEIGLKILTKVFSDIEILILKDRDMLSGRRATMSDRVAYLADNPRNHRVLERFELENYLYDKEVLNKYCQLCGTQFDNARFNRAITNIQDQDVKGMHTEIKGICGIVENIGAEALKLKLARLITHEMGIYSVQ